MSIGKRRYMKKQSNTPQMRFQNFEDEWINQSLGKTVEIIMGQSPDSKNYTDDPNDHILVQGNADMKNGRVFPRVWTTQVTKLAEKGDLILSVRAPVGDIGKTDYNVVLGRGVAAIKGNEFLFQLLTKMKQSHYWSKLSTGSTFESINSNDIKSAEIYLPSVEEQSAIGSLFLSLDDLLASYKDNLANYQSLKATMLSKMFPKAGQTVPEIRLDGFEGEWEEKKLGSLGSVAMNKRIFKDETSDYGDIPFYKIGTFGGTADSFITKEKFKEYKEKYPYPEIGDILISASGSIGRTVVYNGEDAYYQDSNIVWLKHDQQLDNSYLKQYYGIIKWSGIEGTTIKRLYNKNILETNIFLPPSVAEQRAIGTYFSNLDNLINSYQEKISQLETLKKKLLQDMFI